MNKQHLFPLFRIGLMLTGLFVCCFLPAGGENYPYRSDVLWVTAPDHADWIYKTGEQASVTVSVYLYGILQENIEIAYSAGPEQFPDDTRGSIRTENGKAVIPVGTLQKPGFRDCKFSVALNGETYRHHLKVGFSPEQIRPVVGMPDDFRAFWEKTLQEAAACPFEVSVRYVEKFSSPAVACYGVKLQCFKKGSYVYGYLTKPKAPGKYPVVFNPPGAGIKPMDPVKTLYLAENGLICFNMEIHGLDPALDEATYRDLSAAFRDNNSYLTNGLDNRDNYYLKKVYAACIRTLDYLVSLPEYDGKNLIALGASQGGALALVTAALDERVTLCVAAHPALADMAAYPTGQAGGYPHFFTKFNGQDTPEKIAVMACYDAVNFARLIRVPVFLTWGFNDNTCPPTTSYAVYNVITAPKEALITPVNEHWISAGTRMAQVDWIRERLKK